MAIKNVYIFQPKKGRRTKLFPLSFSTDRAIPRLVAPQQSQSPFHSTKQKIWTKYFYGNNVNNNTTKKVNLMTTIFMKGQTWNLKHET